MRHKFVVFLVVVGGMLVVRAAYGDNVVFRHVRIIDGNGGAPMEDASLVIEGDHIAAVRADSAATAPAGAEVRDLSGKTVLPGLISDHSHVGLIDGLSAAPQNYNRQNIVRQLKQFQRYGITTVMALGLNDRLAYPDLRAEAHADTLGGADLFAADCGIGIPDGAPPVVFGPNQLYRPQTPELARAAVREMAERHADLIKVWVDDFHHSLKVKMSPEMYGAVIDEAHKLGLRVAAHVYYLDDARTLVAAGVDILAHGVRDQAVDNDFIKQIKTAGTWYIATLGLDESFYIFAEHPEWMKSAFLTEALQPALANQFNNPTWRAVALGGPHQVEVDKASLQTNMKNLKSLYDAGVKIGFGTDSGATPLRIPGFAEHRELALSTEAGLTPLAAITLATRNAAELMRLDDRGVIAAGKRADLLVVDGDPSKNIKDVDRIDSVWQRGKRVADAMPQ
jgi:imidazolonepropionase-like amidohydrolase